MRSKMILRTGNRLARASALAMLAAMTLAADGSAGHAVAQEQAVGISIPAGSLSSALNALAGQSGLQIGFDSALVRGLTTRGLTGNFTPGAALDQLLSESGLTYSFSDSRTVVVQASAASASNSDVAVSGDGALVLDPIIIQGEKIARDVFSTYTSTGVTTAQDLKDYSRNTIGQALNAMGNVRSFETGAGNSSFIIRGLNADGVTQPSRSAPVISVVVDGAQQGIEATRRGTRGVWDVEQIEVLRGPQSTLQGRDSLAGSVQIKTKDPTWTPEVAVEGIAGNNDFFSGAFAVSAPIIEDQLAFRLSGQGWRSTRDIDYVDPALAELGKDEFQEIRGKLLFTPEALPGFTGLFTFSHTHDKPSWAMVTGPDFFDRRFVDGDLMTAEFRDTSVNRYIADLSYEITPDWTVRSVTSFVDTNVEITAPGSSVFIRDDSREGSDWSQDVRLTYESADSPFSGVFGLFAGRFESQQDSRIQVHPDRVDVSGISAMLGFPVTLPAGAQPFQTLTSSNRTESVAAYADMRYRLTDQWTVMAGGRLLYDRVSARNHGSVLNQENTILSWLFMGGGSGPLDPYLDFDQLDENNAISNTAFLPKLGLAFDITENQTVAATVSKGYRAGFSELIVGTTTINTVEPEYLWSYDLAYRSRWLDDTLHLNANVFYYDYRNQQIPIIDVSTGQTRTANVGKSHSYGAELEARWLPDPSIELFSSIGLLKTRFDEGSVSINGAMVPLAGNAFPEAPTVTASLGGIWRHQSGFFAGGDVSFTGGYYSLGDLENTLSRKVSSFTLVNAQLGYETDNFSVAAFAKNIFDKQYLTGIGEGGTQATIGDGRSFGLRVTGRF